MCKASHLRWWLAWTLSQQKKLLTSPKLKDRTFREPCFQWNVAKPKQKVITDWPTTIFAKLLMEEGLIKVNADSWHREQSVFKSHKWYLAYSILKIYIPLHCSWSDKAPVSKEDSECWPIFFCPNVEFFIDFRKYKRTCFKFYAKQVLVWKVPNW